MELEFGYPGPRGGQFSFQRVKAGFLLSSVHAPRLELTTHPGQFGLERSIHLRGNHANHSLTQLLEFVLQHRSLRQLALELIESRLHPFILGAPVRRFLFQVLNPALSGPRCHPAFLEFGLNLEQMALQIV